MVKDIIIKWVNSITMHYKNQKVKNTIIKWYNMTIFEVEIAPLIILHSYERQCPVT
jgi:hypothetical protein